jgi:4,5-dihydroxyphthalate decarboxylase
MNEQLVCETKYEASTEPLLLSVAVADYAHTQALFDGRVKLQNIKLNRVKLPVDDIIKKFLNGAPWAISEMSMGKYVEQTANGTCDYIALPIFPYRAFRHAAFYVRSNSPLSYDNLRKLTIGIPGKSVTAVIYARALLTHQLGVLEENIEWVVGEINQCASSLPNEDFGDMLDEKPALTSMLLSGQIDILISPHVPHVDSAGIRHLFPEHARLDYDYWQTTRIFPIMHTIVLRKDVEIANPGTALKLTEAFSSARDKCLDILRDPSEMLTPLPFLSLHTEWLNRTFGFEYLPYGVEKNRVTLNAFLDFCHEQGVSKRRVELKELFQY